MPIYEYRCETCRKVSSFLIRSLETHHPPACPKCGAKKTARKLSVFASSVKSSTGASAPPPACGMGRGGSCGRCCAGVPHSH